MTTLPGIQKDASIEIVFMIWREDLTQLLIVLLGLPGNLSVWNSACIMVNLMFDFNQVLLIQILGPLKLASQKTEALRYLTMFKVLVSWWLT